MSYEYTRTFQCPSTIPSIISISIPILELYAGLCSPSVVEIYHIVGLENYPAIRMQIGKSTSLGVSPSNLQTLHPLDPNAPNCPVYVGTGPWIIDPGVPAAFFRESAHNSVGWRWNFKNGITLAPGSSLCVWQLNTSASSKVHNFSLRLFV